METPVDSLQNWVSKSILDLNLPVDSENVNRVNDIRIYPTIHTANMHMRHTQLDAGIISVIRAVIEGGGGPEVEKFPIGD
jgi:hypothetical protein